MQTTIVWVLLGAVFGAGVAALFAAARLRTAQAARVEDQKKVVELQATLQAERAAAGEKLALLEQAREKLSETFASLSADALRRNNDEFLRLANENLQKFREQASGDFKLTKAEIDNLVKPVSETLGKLERQVGELEVKREGAYHTLTQQVKELATGQSALGKETRNLVTALRAPATRGRWGEVQLKRVAELAGMVEYCDFVEQETIEGEDGRLRPDMIVKLPNDRCVVVDAKAPLMAYLEAVECTDEDTRQERLAQHARQVRDHMMKLASKAYWKQIGESPEFVVMFLPGESFYSAALEQDPSLIEFGADSRVILATPTTLIALLHAVAYGWRQEKLAEDAEQIARLGADLHVRLVKVLEHVTKVGRGLRTAVDAYNDAVGSIESRLLVQARKFQGLAAPAERGIEVLEPIDRQVRHVQALELGLPEESAAPDPDSGAGPDVP
ncbi:MAG: DNA recombination protein RmuC [Coriobacteriaceae bacterium]|nr:DNA recombination protein RmuC [Coriobacteriaceae bacterium]